MLGSVLDEGDVVTMLVQGGVRGYAGVAALLPGKVVLVNERQWKPDVVVLPLDASLTVQGWQDERSAALTFIVDDRHDVVERILDRGLAIEIARRIRDMAGGHRETGPAPAGAPQPPPPPPPPPPA
ncbi:MAG TPA: hypothetical protein VFM27_01585 [Acidimicrobiales bacterium]|nr:hypothetical protein [Acidimicrobiales bacterium]